MSTLSPAGAVSLRKIPRSRKAPFSWRVRNLPNYLRGYWKILLARALRMSYIEGRLYLRKITADGIVDYGCVSHRVVTTAGVNYLVDAFQGSAEPENFKFHGFGTGTTAEAVGDTALNTELTTEYATDNTRVTGSQTEGSSANIYKTVATLDPDANVAITEHGVFSASTAGTLLDRSVFSAVNLSSTGDTLEATYELTTAAGS